jgi:hypothetical protein
MKKGSILTKISLAILLAGGTLVGTAFAAPVVTYTPTKVGCFDTGHCFIVVNPVVPVGSSTCANRDQVRWLLSTAGGPEMFRTALSAQMAGRTVNVQVYDGSTCVDGYPQAMFVYAN